MATNTSNSTTSSKLSSIPMSAIISWLVLYIAELLAIVILNTITITVFVKQRQLQRRSTYLIIHLAIVDLLVGAVSGPLCMTSPRTDNVIFRFLRSFLIHLLPVTSMTNLAAISLERLHATFFPFGHRIVKKWAYVRTIGAIWLTSTSMQFTVTLLSERILNSSKLIIHYMYFSYFLIVILVICICNGLIFMKVRCFTDAQYHATANRNRERKLTTSLLIVTFASLLTLLPTFIYLTIEIFFSASALNISKWPDHQIFLAVIALLALNSLINPIIYSIRMPEFRAGVAIIFHRAPNRVNPNILPLQDFVGH